MNVAPNVNLERIEEADLKLQSQLNKCLNEKRRRQCETGYLDELAGLLSASASDMCSLSVKPDKCAILQETVNQIRRIKQEAEECGSGDDLQQSEVSSSKPNILANDVLGPLLLEALDGFLFMVNTDGKIEFVSENIKSFLKYSQDNLVDKSIYNIIHVGDHARFSSNLLPMSIGNGFSWSSETNATVSKSRSFNCRFLIKPPEDQEETMEEKQTRVSQYENMQIAAVLLPFPGENSENSEVDSEVQNRLVCVARRMPPNEKNNPTGVEQFTTRLDMTGKILAIDTSGVSATYSQYLNKELVGRIIQELCHPSDFQKLNQHLKETLQIGSNTSGVYKLRVAQEKYIHVQTKSKRFNFNPMTNEQEFIVATHSIIRDNDHSVEGSSVVSQRSNPSPASGPIAPSLGSSMNGNSYSFSSLSPQEFILNDIGLDIFPSSSWDLGSNDGPEVGDGANLPTSLGGPSTPASTSSVTSGAQRTQPPPGSAFSPDLISGRGSPSIRSPAQLSSTSSPAPGRVTPYGNTFPFSPVQNQPVSRTSSPAPTLMKREDLAASSSELSNLSPVSVLMSDSQGASNATQKLRNLLTQGIEEADSSVPKSSVGENIDSVVSGIADSEASCTPRGSADSVSSRNENIILRELLNQDDEDMNDECMKTSQSDSQCGSASGNVDMCMNDALQKRTLNNNNMLRKLLNNDDDDKNYTKNQNLLIQQLLKTEGKMGVDSNLTSTTAAVAGLSSTLCDVINSVVKRKSPDTPSEDSSIKRQNIQITPHAHLAGQNPMLASMLAQTPRTAPSVPTSIANAIVSQLPQERLPKNLKEKLVHTPYTGTSTAASNTATNSQYNYSQMQGNTRSLLATSLQQEVVTADSRGHMTLTQQSNNTSNYSQTQGYLGKILTTADSSQVTNLQPITGYGNHFNQNSQQQSAVQSASIILTNIGGDSNINNLTTVSDPLLSDILEQVWSMEQDLNLDSTAADESVLYKLLDEIHESTPTPSPRPTSAHDMNEKLAISAIQRQLMSFEVPSTTSNSSSSPQFPQPVTPPMIVAQSQLSPSTYSQVSHYQAAPPAYTASANIPAPRVRIPITHTVQTGQQQIVTVSNQRPSLPQYAATGALNMANLPPHMRHTLMERRKKQFLQQQQRRLLVQQQQQQLTMQTQQPITDNLQSPFPENMNELLNNTVAPNVTLQRSTSVPEQQLTPRYTTMQQLSNSTGQSSTPSQLSPGQRQQPPFSPLPQQSYSNNYPQARLSPHLSAQAGATQSWVQRASQNSANLQQQNPMLNAQLSQQGSYVNQVQSRFPTQQQQPRQIVVRPMPSPSSRNSPYPTQPDSPFHPPSPGVSIYQQQSPAVSQQQQSQSQQRLQRTVSIPSRVNSPRALQAGYVGNDPMLSPQPSPGSYNPPVSSYSSQIPVSTTTGYNPDSFGFDQQVYPAATIDRSRGSSSSTTSEYVRQELRAMVGARTQQQQGHQQQLIQQLPLGAPVTQATGPSTSQSLSHADFEALGLSLGPEGQPSSPALFPQSLLSVASGSDTSQSRTNSPRFQMEEPRPVEQKKSLLQQLLSEPP